MFKPLPNGRRPVNPEGVQYYNNLINELKKYGIEPHVTLLHFDLPQSLEDEYSGLLSPKIVEDFTAYADVCFREFGDRVKYWITVNEPNIEPILGHDLGIFPPNHCSSSLASSLGLNCSKGNSSVEPYVVGHNLLLSHASAVSPYRKKYQVSALEISGFRKKCRGGEEEALVRRRQQRWLKVEATRRRR
ncbi:hypothetical protein ZIOFF_055516 [Zingiber officinale]|uniref:Uncharacterized protein n=1 Tax=Zingiber officinale TaxID=94328 RepID=A0A8J5KSC8_ZINOF|nr:hypothetical protein ZIOFF_055516 [Zingiber officinale]